MAYPRFTPERSRDELERLHHVEGVSVRGLAKLEGCTFVTMKGLLDRLGIEIRLQRGTEPAAVRPEPVRPHLSPATRAALVADYLAGDAPSAVGERYGCHLETVNRAVRAAGHRLRDQRAALDLAEQQAAEALAARYALREGALTRVARTIGVDEQALRAALDAEGLLLHDLDEKPGE